MRNAFEGVTELGKQEIIIENAYEKPDQALVNVKVTVDNEKAKDMVYDKKFICTVIIGIPEIKVDGAPVEIYASGNMGGHNLEHLITGLAYAAKELRAHQIKMLKKQLPPFLQELVDMIMEDTEKDNG